MLDIELLPVLDIELLPVLVPLLVRVPDTVLEPVLVIVADCVLDTLDVRDDVAEDVPVLDCVVVTELEWELVPLDVPVDVPDVLALVLMVLVWVLLGVVNLQSPRLPVR